MRRRKSWEELEIRDNFLFLKVMRKPELCKGLLEKVLHIRIKTLSFLAIEKPIEIDPASKAVRLDLYVEDEHNRAFDVEMQASRPKENDGPLGLRTRYYQSLMDQRALEKGHRYGDLRETFIIFICAFDPFGQNLRRYTFREQCLEVPELHLDDRSTKIFLNALGTIGEEDEDIRHFLEYVARREPVGAFTQDVAAEVARVKQHEKTRLEYMSLGMMLDDEYYAGRQEGRQEGWNDGQEQIMAYMRSQGRTAEEIHDITGLPLEVVKESIARIQR